MSNSSNGYLILRDIRTTKGKQTEILALDGRWYLEADDGFESLRDAKLFLQKHYKYETYALRYYVRGPFGGTYDVGALK